MAKSNDMSAVVMYFISLYIHGQLYHLGSNLLLKSTLYSKFEPK